MMARYKNLTLATDFWRQQDPVFSLADPVSTFSRSYSAHRHYPVGDVTRLESVGNDVLRCSWQRDAGTGLFIRGAHLESGRTNYAKINTIVPVSWTLDGVTASDIAAELPTGFESVNNVLHEDTSTGQHRCYITAGVQPSDTYACSCYFYPLERTRARLFFGNGTTDQIDINFNTACIYAQSAGVVDTGIRERADGWWYVWFTSSATIGPWCQLSLLDDTGSASYTGSDIDGMAVWGYQVEAGEYPSSLIVTAGAAATRTADSDWEVAGPYPDAGQGWMCGKYYITPHANSAEIPIMTLSDGGGAADRLRLAINTSGVLEVQSACSGGDPGLAVSSVSVMDGRWSGHDWYITWRPGELCLAVDGVFGTTDYAVTIPDNLNTLQLHPSGGIIGDIQMGRKFSRIPWRIQAAA